jgi:hypothetical protein
MKTWTIQRNWQHWVQHNPEKLATLGTTQSRETGNIGYNIHDILTPIKTWTTQRNWQHWVQNTRYLNTNQNMDNPEKLTTLGKTYTGRYLNTNQSKHGQSRETGNIG